MAGRVVGVETRGHVTIVVTLNNLGRQQFAASCDQCPDRFTTSSVLVGLGQYLRDHEHLAHRENQT